jgi:hypothetical protein
MILREKLSPAPLAILVALIYCFVLAGCSLAQDNREKIAFAVLYNGKGVLNTKLFSNVLMERFSSQNSSPGELDSFVKSLGGSCHAERQAADSLICSVPETATVCVESFIRISASLSASRITTIQAEQVLRGC